MKYVCFISCLYLMTGICFSVFAQAQESDLSILTNAKSPFADGDILVTLGDSITQFGDAPNGYVTLLKDAFLTAGHPVVTVVNAGISGNEVPDLQARLDRDVLSKKPTMIFIYIGINDVWHHGGNLDEPKVRFETGLRQIIHKLQQQGITVVLATPTVIGEKADGSNPLDKALDIFSSSSRSIAREMNIELCDLRKTFIDYLKIHNREKKDSSVLTLDTVHLNAAGNRLVAKQAAKSLVKARGNKIVSLVMNDVDFTDKGRIAINFLPTQNTAGLIIRYTLDSSPPNAKSPRYLQPIEVDKTTTITAQVFKRSRAVSYAISATATKLPAQE